MSSRCLQSDGYKRQAGQCACIIRSCDNLPLSDWSNGCFRERNSRKLPERTLVTLAFLFQLTVSRYICRIIFEEYDLSLIHILEREFEETMHRTSSGIDSSDACRGEYNVFLFGIFADVTQECRFPCTRFPSQENRLTRILNQVQGVLKRCVIGVYAHNQIIPKCFIALLMPSSSMGAVT